jgi:chromosome segregation ATPase
MSTLAALLLLLVASPLMAQEVSADSATPPTQGYAPGGPPPPAPATPVGPSADVSAVAAALVLPLRTENQLQQAMIAADTDLRRAQTRLSTASHSNARLKAMAQQSRVELREIEAKRKLADEEKRKADRSMLEAEKRTTQRQLRSAERVEAIGDAERETARGACLAAFAKHQALERELELAQMRAGRKTATGNHPGADEGSRVVMGELERQTLEAQQKYRRLAHQLARNEEDLSNKRLELYRSASP